MEEGPIPVLVELLEAGTPRQKELVAAIRLQLCESSVLYRKMVACEGAIPPLVAFAKAGTARAKKKAEALILRDAKAAKIRQCNFRAPIWPYYVRYNVV